MAEQQFEQRKVRVARNVALKPLLDELRLVATDTKGIV